MIKNNAAKYLRNGEVDFVFRCTSYDYERLIENARKAPNRIEIINGFLSVIYDIPEFIDKVYRLLDIRNVNSKIMNNLLHNFPLNLKVLRPYLIGY